MLRRSWAFLIVAALAVTACEGPEGPAGPTGPAGTAGPAGPAGPQGPAGQAASENCTQCHLDNTDLFARQVQYAASTHRNGGNFERGNSASCAACHAHEGFIERIAAGTTAPAAGIDNPSPVNCRTCHQIHTTYTDADYALTSTAPIVLFNTSDGTIDLGAGAGNLCGQCHQARDLATPVPGGADVKITSSRYGYHHGPQANVVGGVGAVEFEGSEDILGGVHTHGDATNDKNAGVCATCHMATPYGAQSGGHTWFMAYDYHGSTEDNVAGCQTCHKSADDFAYISDVPGQVKALLDAVEVELLRLGVKVAAGSVYAVPGTYSAEVAGGMLNWQMFTEDRSGGLHNPPYVIRTLTNTLEVLKKE